MSNAKPKKFLMINPAEISPEGVAVRTHPPLGAISVISVLSQCGWDVKLLDITAEAKLVAIKEPQRIPYIPYEIVYSRNGVDRKAVFWRNGLSDEEIIQAIRDYNPSVLGISCVTLVTRAEVKRLSALFKRVFPHIPVVLGGHEPTVHYNSILRGNEMERIDAIDFIVLGPGQPVIEEVAKYLIGEMSIKDFIHTELVEKYQEKYVFKARDLQGFDPNKYPLIDYSYLPGIDYDGDYVDLYSFVGITHAGDLGKMFRDKEKKLKYLPLFTSFGCGYRCSFCDNSEAFPHKRYSPENVLKMIGSYRKKFGEPDYIDVMDNNFGGMGISDYNTALDVLEALKPFNYKIDFSNGLTSDFRKI